MVVVEFYMEGKVEPESYDVHIDGSGGCATVAGRDFANMYVIRALVTKRGLENHKARTYCGMMKLVMMHPMAMVTLHGFPKERGSRNTATNG